MCSSDLMTWLPKLWSDNARLITTAIPGDATKALSERNGTETEALGPITRDEARQVIDGICGRYHRTFEPEVIEALADVPLPAEFLTRVADSRGDVEAMFERQGVNPRYYQEGAALLGHEGARAGGGTLGGLLRGLPQDVKVMPQMDEVSAQELAQSFV